MQKLEVGKFGSDVLTFCQCETLDEAKEHNLPEGTHFYWIYKGSRIYSPGEIVAMVVSHSKDGTFGMANVASSTKLQEYYKNLCESQRQTTVAHLQKMKSTVTEQMNGAHPEVVKAQVQNLDQTIDMYTKNAPVPGIDGLFRPTREQAEVLLQGKENLEKMLPPEMQEKVFGKE